MSPPQPAPQPQRTTYIYIITLLPASRTLNLDSPSPSSPSSSPSASTHAFTSRIRANAVARRELRNHAAEFEHRPRLEEWMDEAGLFRGSAVDPDVQLEGEGVQGEVRVEIRVEVRVDRVLLVEGEDEGMGDGEVGLGRVWTAGET